MVSFFTRRPVMMAAVITGELAAHDHAHQVQHFVVEDFAMLDGALQRFLGVIIAIFPCFWAACAPFT
jgi:hypothetical protein